MGLHPQAQVTCAIVLHMISKAPSFWHIGWRSLRRDWRAGELRLLLLAVTLAVAALTSVSFFADRLQGGLARDAKALIGEIGRAHV